MTDNTEAEVKKFFEGFFDGISAFIKGRTQDEMEMVGAVAKTLREIAPVGVAVNLDCFVALCAWVGYKTALDVQAKGLVTTAIGDEMEKMRELNRRVKEVFESCGLDLQWLVLGIFSEDIEQNVGMMRGFTGIGARGPKSMRRLLALGEATAAVLENTATGKKPDGPNL